MKLHTRYYADPKVEGLDDAAEVMFVRSLALAGDREQRGFIPGTSLPLLARRRRYERLVSALVAAGLWTPVDDGYVITAWSDWQDAADALAERRTADRERQRRRRRRQKESASRDIADLSRDVTATEGETELELAEPKGGENSRAAPERPPPRRCEAHADWPPDRTVPPCGACADARRSHDTWQASANGHGQPEPPDSQQAARTRADAGIEHVRSVNAEPVDRQRNLAGLNAARAARRPPTTTEDP